MVVSKQEARAAGAERYFTGAPCKHGHIAERYVKSGHCVVCAVEKARERYEENRDVLLEYQRQYAARNPEVNREASRRYREKHPDRRAATTCRYVENNPDQVKASKHVYRIKNRDKISAYNNGWRCRNKVLCSHYARDWGERNPEKRRELLRRFMLTNPGYFIEAKALRRARKKQATPAWANRAAIREIYREAANISKQTGVVHHVDHIIPLVNELVCGLHVEANLQVVPAGVNLRKSNSFQPGEY